MSETTNEHDKGEQITSKCPVFANGCPFSSALEEKGAFRGYLERCKEFEGGCPFKDLDSIKQLKQIISTQQLSKDYSEHILLTHKNLQVADWNTLKDTCPAFRNGCIFSQGLDPSTIDTMFHCPVWKNGCPFKKAVSNGGSLVEALQSNSWDVLITSSLGDVDVSDADLDNELNESAEHPILLAKMLKDGTAESHSLAESVQFVKRFRKKQITLELYQLFIRNLYFVYNALEDALESVSKVSENARRLYFPQLLRVTTLEQDISFYYGVHWREEVLRESDDLNDIRNMSPATANYVLRIRHCAAQPNAGELLIAHAYTRYLGDLSGGQLLKRMARRSLGLKAAPRNATVAQVRILPHDQVDGTRFYDFLEIEDATTFKNEYRTILDSLDLTTDQANEMLAEANISFRLNMELFQELDEIAGFVPEQRSIRTSNSSNSIVPPHGPSVAGQIPPPECPFSSMFNASSTPPPAAASSSSEGTTSALSQSSVTPEGNLTHEQKRKLVSRPITKRKFSPALVIALVSLLVALLTVLYSVSF